jgi:hypothetical protein
MGIADSESIPAKPSLIETLLIVYEIVTQETQTRKTKRSDDTTIIFSCQEKKSSPNHSHILSNIKSNIKSTLSDNPSSQLVRLRRAPVICNFSLRETI